MVGVNEWYTDTLPCAACGEGVDMGAYNNWENVGGSLLVLCRKCIEDHYLTCQPYEEEEYYESKYP